MIRCLAVDDEMLSLDLLEDNIRRIPFLHLVARCSNAFEALSVMQRERIDLIFLDIQMPGLTGVQFLESLASHRPMVIFVTAYKKYALDGFDLDVLDYLVKPVPFERFVKAVNKAASWHSMKQAASIQQGSAGEKPASSTPADQVQLTPSTENARQQPDNSEKVEVPAVNTADLQSTNNNDENVYAAFFFVNVEYNLVRINVREISFVEGLKDYIKIHLHQQPRPVITRMSMKSISEKLPLRAFMRVHKSYIISLDRVNSVRKNRIYIEQHIIPVSDSYRDEFFKRIAPGTLKNDTPDERTNQ
ncbi:response regulator transcription factor [Pseudoflavitalea sp. G-6-1-2]|uniref:LytR/AlgR family response regulator transcription factor n=1 Tax=Pseudoflavitalea sp. G-6-1-2 TaxID=2728841 RepID=UPI00146F4FF0|nr:response regulator transcription factor [Pseudoflavitalea sp. G-6-1-2]NML23939.1 response regulator transcription factor [Pseudoflavitalea sp. G-6-1-2]